MVSLYALGNELLDLYLPLMKKDDIIVTGSKSAYKRLQNHGFKEAILIDAERSKTRNDTFRHVEKHLDETPLDLGRIEKLVVQGTTPIYQAVPLVLYSSYDASLPLLVEYSTLDPNVYAFFKEISIIALANPVYIVDRRIAPPSAKTRSIILDYISLWPVDTGIYTFRLRRIKYYEDYRKWHIEASNLLNQVKGLETDNPKLKALIDNLTLAVREVETKIKGTEFTYPLTSMKQLENLDLTEILRTKPLLTSLEGTGDFYQECLASRDFITLSKVLANCRENRMLRKEAIFVSLAKPLPPELWPPKDKDFARAMRQYSRLVSRYGEEKIHPQPPAALGLEKTITWQDVIMFGMDSEGLEIVIGQISKQVRPLSTLISILDKCAEYDTCREALSAYSIDELEDALKNLVESIETLARDAKILSKLTSLAEKLDIPVGGVDIPEVTLKDEYSDNIVIFLDLLRQSDVDQELVDTLEDKIDNIMEAIRAVLV